MMNKPVHPDQAILDLSKTVMYEFHYDYMKPKFKDLQLCYMDTDLLIYRIGTNDFYADIMDDIPTRFDTTSYCDNRPCTGGVHPLPIGLNKQVIGLMKDELGGGGGGNIMTEFALY